MKTIAAIITCFNRREKTVSCLLSLFESAKLSSINLHVIVVDDGSSDGTSAAIRAIYPDVEIIQGNGSLFWNGGMHLGFARALDIGFDAYLWLNDDTVIYPNTINLMIESLKRQSLYFGRDCIIVGSTCDPVKKTLTYGGVVSTSKFKRLNFALVEPNSIPIECHTMNGNCVLIPNSVASSVGNLDPVFMHAMGDTDYGLRALNSGFKLCIAPGFVGECARNTTQGGFNDRTLSLKLRWKMIMQPKGLPPKSWFAFTRKHAGPFWPIFFVWPYFKLVI